MSKIIRVCPHCGKEFEDYERKKNNKVYCSRECYVEHKGIGVKKYGICKVCGEKFELVHGKGTMVCSSECLGKLRSTLLSQPKQVKICKNCGKTYELDYTTSSREYCCRECYWEYRRLHKEGFAYSNEKRTENAHEKRTCEMCGREFVVYKKYPKRFCSNECRVKYANTNECKQKRISTMLERYGKASVGNGVSAERLAEYEHLRKAKYEDLCNRSNVEIIDYIDKHILHVRCQKCGKDFITNNLSYLPYEKIYCKYCSEEYKSYKPSVKIYQILEENGVNFVKNDRTTISPYELDIFIPSLKLAFEINGNFWHSELCGKDKNYHLNKTKMCYEQGIKLVHIYEDEIVNKWDIVESRIKSMLFLSEKIYGRKCNIIELSPKEKKEFLIENHIQGDANSKINFGLSYSGKLVAVMTFSKERVIYNGHADDGNYELIRYANKCGTNVIGGFSKLLKHFISHYNPKKIKTFCDIRWSGMNHSQTVYEKCGFKYIDESKPNYWYMHKNDLLTRKHRYTFTKHVILKKHPTLDNTKTEWELMKELGYNRIWDCGNMRFELHLD